VIFLEFCSPRCTSPFFADAKYRTVSFAGIYGVCLSGEVGAILPVEHKVFPQNTLRNFLQSGLRSQNVAAQGPFFPAQRNVVSKLVGPGSYVELSLSPFECGLANLLEGGTDANDFLVVARRRMLDTRPTKASLPWPGFYACPFSEAAPRTSLSFFPISFLFPRILGMF